MTKEEFKKWLGDRVAVLDGAMGTMIQRHGLGEDDFRGELLANHPRPLAGNNDLLVLTRPDVIADIHRQYIAAGADIISTDTFNANRVSQLDYDTTSLVSRINREGARLARRVADEVSGRRVLVAGSVGPTNRTASMSPDVASPATRNIDFDELVEAYREQVAALVEGGADLLIMETVFDTLNLKAALTAAGEFDIPVMVSVTIADKTGRTLTGQTLDAFMVSIGGYDNIVSVGLNCSFGPDAIAPFVREIASRAPGAVSVHPNAGLPDENGFYTETPERFVAALRPLVADGVVNIVGGCCGTTPAHIAALVEMVKGARGHRPDTLATALRLAGLEALEVTPGFNFVNVGERCNVAGSRKFLRLIKEGKIDEAAEIARRQVEDGAMIIDINMDDAMLDAPAEMERFLRYIAVDPEIARVPVMIDSSRDDVIERGLKQIAGRPVVNSISLKEGEEKFIASARMIRRAGAAVVVMAFDEKGQADTAARKIEIARRSYDLLTRRVGFAPEDIIFDPGIMSIATGLDEHDNYAVDFIEAVRWIKANLAGASTSGGVSNLSFSLRGHNRLREAMHAVFLYHAIAAGLDMAIVNPATSVTYDDIDPELRELLTDVILNRRPGARDELIARAQADVDKASSADAARVDAWHDGDVDNRLSMALVKGNDTYLKADLDEALAAGRRAVEIIEGPLMAGMNRVGQLFGEGKMFLPQVVKTARTMKVAVDILQPVMERERRENSTTSAGKVILATVKGDVHDIGKNIVGIVLACNNFEVIDLGVMVPADEIVKRVLEERPVMVGLSGLITPSLGEMVNVARALERAGDDTPLVVGGATTSLLHTALKIAPERSGAVIHSLDASRNPGIAAALSDPDSRRMFLDENRRRQETLRREHEEVVTHVPSLEECRVRAVKVTEPSPEPLRPGVTLLDPVTLDRIVPLINWRMFFHAWRLTGSYLEGFPYDLCDGCIARWEATLTPEIRPKAMYALSLYRDARAVLDNPSTAARFAVRAAVALLPARSDGDDIIVDNRLTLPMLRSLSAEESHSLADWITADGRDWIGAFSVTAVGPTDADDDYRRLLVSTLCDRLVEAASEWLHKAVRRELWGYAPDENLTPREMMHGDFRGIRPAVGYPSMPDQTIAASVASLLPMERLGVSITGNGALSPSSSELGLYFAAPSARYFTIPRLSREQLDDYARRRDIPVDVLAAALTPLL